MSSDKCLIKLVFVYTTLCM